MRVSDLPFERCMRLVPHDRNTGAFSIAVLQKVPLLPVQDINISPLGSIPTKNDDPRNQVTEETNGLEVNIAAAMDENDPEESSQANSIDNEDGAAAEESGRIGGKRKLQIQGKWKGVDPVIFFKDETIINSIKKFYGIDDSVLLGGHLVSRNSDTNHAKRIYYVSKSVKDVLELNFQVGQQLKISFVGLKMFERQTSQGASTPCSLRISLEGLPVILPYITKQILYAYPQDFKHLPQYKTIKFADFMDSEFGERRQS